MQMVLGHINSLKEELDSIQETEGEMEAVMEHIHALQKILESAKMPVCKSSMSFGPNNGQLDEAN